MDGQIIHYIHDVCTRRCMHICIYVLIHVCLYKCNHACVCTYICVNDQIRMYACMYPRMYICLHVFLSVCLQVCMYGCIYACYHMYKCTICKYYRIQFPLYTKDMCRVDVLLNATTRRDVNGMVVGVLGVGQVCMYVRVCVRVNMFKSIHRTNYQSIDRKIPICLPTDKYTYIHTHVRSRKHTITLSAIDRDIPICLPTDKYTQSCVHK